MVERLMALLFIQPITLSLSLLQRMTSNDDNKRKMEEEAESSMVRKRLRLSDDGGIDDISSDSPEREPEEETEEEEVSSEETSMNQLDTSEEKLHARCACDILFNDDSESPSMSSEPPHQKVAGAPMRRAAMMMTTMTSGCR
jgi:hypothetical protein